MVEQKKLDTIKKRKIVIENFLKKDKQSGLIPIRIDAENLYESPGQEVKKFSYYKIYNIIKISEDYKDIFLKFIVFMVDTSILKEANATLTPEKNGIDYLEVGITKITYKKETDTFLMKNVNSLNSLNSLCNFNWSKRVIIDEWELPQENEKKNSFVGTHKLNSIVLNDLPNIIQEFIKGKCFEELYKLIWDKNNNQKTESERAEQEKEKEREERLNCIENRIQTILNYLEKEKGEKIININHKSENEKRLNSIENRIETILNNIQKEKEEKIINIEGEYRLKGFSYTINLSNQSMIEPYESKLTIVEEIKENNFFRMKVKDKSDDQQDLCIIYKEKNTVKVKSVNLDKDNGHWQFYNLEYDENKNIKIFDAIYREAGKKSGFTGHSQWPLIIKVKAVKIK